jgi:hypothetical protein
MLVDVEFKRAERTALKKYKDATSKGGGTMEESENLLRHIVTLEFLRRLVKGKRKDLPPSELAGLKALLPGKAVPESDEGDG